MLKLPKNIREIPNLAALEAYFTTREAPLPGQRQTVSHWPMNEALETALKVALGTGHLRQGLELIKADLDREAKGIRAVREKSGQPPAERLSRLILLASDGSERFYHDAASLLARHADRTWGCLVDATASRLGATFTAKGGQAKALMINDKTALGLFLTTLAQNI